MADAAYAVLKNGEDQYALWLRSKQPPDGWVEVGFSGTEADCVAYVDEVWTDMRPRSLRDAEGPRR